MDSWASLEHVLSYKSEQPIDIEIRERLKKCARKMAEVDLEMQKISQELKKYSQSFHNIMYNKQWRYF